MAQAAGAEQLRSHLGQLVGAMLEALSSMEDSRWGVWGGLCMCIYLSVCVEGCVGRQAVREPPAPPPPMQA